MRKGIALTELVIVAAIMAAVAVVLVPVFATAQGETGTQKCQARGMKLGAAMLAYMADNDGRFPVSATSGDLSKFASITWRYSWPVYPPGTGPTAWSAGGMNQFAYFQLAKYVKDKETWICPAPTTPYAQKYAYGYRCSWFFRTSNLGVSGYPDTGFLDDNGVGRTLTEVLAKDWTSFGRQLSPSQKFFGWCCSLGEDIDVVAYVGGPVVTPSYAHGEGTNYLFADGHVKWCEMGCGFAPVHYTNHNIDRPHTGG